MPEWWPAVVFGWPAVVVAMALAATAIAFKKPVALLFSALLVAPFGLYLSGSQNWIAFAGPTLVLTLIGSAYAVRRGRSLAAWCLLIPFAGVAAFLAASVWRE